MAISEGDRCLRIAQILCWIPAMAMLIPTSVFARHAYFAMLVIPMSFSAIMALGLLHPKATNKKFITLLDLILTCVYIGMIIPYMIGVRRSWGWRMYRHTNLVMLACFAVFWPMIVFTIHAFFVIRNQFPDVSALWRKMWEKLCGCATCPHCQRQLITDPRLLWDLTPESGSSRSSQSPPETKGSYTKVTAVEEYRDEDEVVVPRPSTDDETARLV